MGYAQVLLHALIRTRRDFGGRGFSHRVTPGQAAWCAWAALAVRQAPGASCNTLGAKAHTKVDTEGGQDAWGRTFDATRGERRGGGKKDGDEPCWSLGVGDRFPATKDARAQLALGDITGLCEHRPRAPELRQARDSAVSAAPGVLRVLPTRPPRIKCPTGRKHQMRARRAGTACCSGSVLDDRMDARLVGFGESEARAVNEENAPRPQRCAGGGDARRRDGGGASARPSPSGKTRRCPRRWRRGPWPPWRARAGAIQAIRPNPWTRRGPRRAGASGRASTTCWTSCRGRSPTATCERH